MNKSLNKICFLLILLFCLTSLWSIDFGGVFYNSTGVTGSSPLGFDQEDTLTFWVKSPLNEAQTTNFAFEGSYNFSYDGSVEQVTNKIDINLLKVDILLPLNNLALNIDIGRIPCFDLTGVIFNQNIDGIQGSLQTDYAIFSAWAGYTGLLNAQSSTYYGIDYEYDQSMLYTLAPKFVVTGINTFVPVLFANQSGFAEFLGCWNIDESNLQRMYLTIGANGPLVNSLYYVLSTTLGFNNGIEALQGVSNLTKLEMTYYSNFLASSITYNASFASGNSTDGIKAFVPFNQISPDVSGNLAYSGIFKTGIATTLQPKNKFLISCGADFIFNTPSEIYSKFVIDGFQWNLNAYWQLFSDLQLSLGSGQYLPIGESTSTADFYANIKLILSF